MPGLDAIALKPSSAFIGGAEYASHIGHYLDCSAQPYDLRPAADIILNAACQLRDTIKDNRPLIILMPEQHSAPAEIELQHLVISRLNSGNRPFIVNSEFPHNNWSMAAKLAMNKDIPPELYYNFNEFDDAGQASLSAYLAYSHGLGAPVAHENLAAFAYHEKIPFFFNDAASFQGVLDTRDPLTQSMAKASLGHDVAGLKLDSSKEEWAEKTWNIRNRFMAHAALERARDINSDLIVQLAGASHVLGWAQVGAGYEESLSAHFMRAGAAVLPVLITRRNENFGLNVLPEEARIQLPHSVVIDGLAEDLFFNALAAEEKSYILDRLYTHSGPELEFRDVEAQRLYYVQCADKDADRLLEKYRLSARNFNI